MDKGELVNTEATPQPRHKSRGNYVDAPRSRIERNDNSVIAKIKEYRERLKTIPGLVFLTDKSSNLATSRLRKEPEIKGQDLAEIWQIAIHTGSYSIFKKKVEEYYKNKPL